jgi:hypothetical protein
VKYEYAIYKCGLSVDYQLVFGSSSRNPLLLIYFVELIHRHTHTHTHTHTQKELWYETEGPERGSSRKTEWEMDEAMSPVQVHVQRDESLAPPLDNTIV